MTTSIIPCDGEGAPWRTEDEEGNAIPPTCPSCLLSNGKDELNVKITKRTKNGAVTLNPATVPAHEIEVEGENLRFVLADGDFKVHTPTCPTLKRDLNKSDYIKPGILVAANPRDAVIQLWDDQIAESDVIADNDSPTEEELSPYYGATDFHRCVSRLDGFGTPKAAKNGATKKASKQMLATLLVEAMAAKLAEITDVNMATSDPDEQEMALVLSGMSNSEMRQTAANWIHHFPADRKRWVASGMAVPVRSDWIGFDAGDGEAAAEPEDVEDDTDLEEEE